MENQRVVRTRRDRPGLEKAADRADITPSSRSPPMTAPTERALWYNSTVRHWLRYQFLAPRLDLYLINYLDLMLVLNFAWILTARARRCIRRYGAAWTSTGAKTYRWCEPAKRQRARGHARSLAPTFRTGAHGPSWTLCDILLRHDHAPGLMFVNNAQLPEALAACS